jgi:hypothetical protein
MATEIADDEGGARLRRIGAPRPPACFRFRSVWIASRARTRPARRARRRDSPASISAASSAPSGNAGVIKGDASSRPVRRTVATRSFASARVVISGLLHMTSIPASRKLLHIASCEVFGVRTLTISMPSSRVASAPGRITPDRGESGSTDVGNPARGGAQDRHRAARGARGGTRDRSWHRIAIGCKAGAGSRRMVEVRRD